MRAEKITVAGGGVLGSQIAFQTAYSGFDATIWLRSEGSVGRCRPKLSTIEATYREAIEEMGRGEAFYGGLADADGRFSVEEARRKLSGVKTHLHLETELETALSGADLLIESMSEKKEAKKEFYRKVAPLLDEKTIVCTNSSSFLPSSFMKDTGRPEKFLALHFANDIYKCNIAEVMRTKETEDAAFEAVIAFASAISMIPLRLEKEKKGCLLNSMLIPFLFSGFDLYADGISTPEDIDRAWTRGTGSPHGPFEILDIVGLETVYEIVKRYSKLPSFMAPCNFHGMVKILEPMIREGKLGRMSGEGFYQWNAKGEKL